MWRIFNDSEVEVIGDGVLDVLAKLGFHCDNDEILRAYGEAGAKVDMTTRTALFPRKMMQAFVESLRLEDKSGWYDQLKAENRLNIYSGYQPYGDLPEFKAPPSVYMFHNLSTFFYDDETQARRMGNHADFITLIKLGDMLHPKQGVGHVLNLAGDTPAPIEPLEAALTLLEYSHNPRGVYVHDIRQIEYLQEIEDIFGIKDPYWHWMANICPNSPLKLDKVAAERYVYMLKTGRYPAKLAAMPVAGVNMPVTVGGTVVIVAAEFLALFLAARLMQSRKIPLLGMAISGTMDMHTGGVSFTAFDATMRRLAIWDFFQRWTDVRLTPGPGEWPPTKTPGMVSTLEKAYFAMIVAAFTGYHPDIGVGHIDAGLTISPAQLLLDYEFTEGLRLLEHRPLTKAQLGLDAIMEIGFGLQGDFLSHPHTAEYCRQESWMPELFSRSGLGAAAEVESMQRARTKVKALLAQYRKPTGHEAQVVLARQVLERAKSQLGNHKN